ncbi:MAG: prepilin-type N-terminal cleavage/methylation domain-containing protein [bacterium]|nr:prepilin-type N-terminal cleavage/methylation domain-containing protein [bacterium]
MPLCHVTGCRRCRRRSAHRLQRGLSLLELTLVLAIGLIIVAGTLYQARQANLDSRIQASKTMLNLVRSELATYRYRNGRYPNDATEFASMPAPAGISATRWLIEPISGIKDVQVIANTATTARTGAGGWVYTPGPNATVSVNLATDSVGGEDTYTW